MDNIIVNIFSIGFHHKRGCEIEYIYPPSIDGNLNMSQLDIWKNLPSLALPDGAHKNSSDTVYFIVPGECDSDQNVLFGVSCFKQISAEIVMTKSEDVTRNTIQKSVVVLSSLPLFGAIGSLLRGITENYFEMGDFDDRTILSESYYQLNKHFKLILEDTAKKCNNIENVLNEDLSISYLIEQYEHDFLTLVKMVLLRKKVLFFMEPIEKLTTTILSLVSIFPGVLKTPSFQNSLNFLEDSSISHSFNQIQDELLGDKYVYEDQNIKHSTLDKSSNSDLNSSGGASLQNLKSSGDQTVKELNDLTLSGVNTIGLENRSMYTPELDHRPIHSEELAIPLPPFLNTARFHTMVDSSILTQKDNWGFPLEIFDQKNIFLPYASINMLNILDNTNIDSFMVGANNQLWKFKSSKYDIIINEGIRNGGIEFCQIHNLNKQDDFNLEKLLQLTVLDRRFVDYLLQVVRLHRKTSTPLGLKKVDLTNSNSIHNLFIDVGEDPTKDKHQDINLLTFPDSKALEEWLRDALLNYIKAILLNAASLGTRLSFEDFGWNFIQAIQQQSFFESWYHSIDRKTIVVESKLNIHKSFANDTLSQLNMSEQAKDDNLGVGNAVRQHFIMNYDHPGRLIQPKIGDNIPGYYQFREYADHSKALVNRSVSEIKRFSTERGSQLKSSMNAGLSKLSGLAKVHGLKFGSSWWHYDDKSDKNETNDEN